MGLPIVLWGLLFSLHTHAYSAATDKLFSGQALARDESLVSSNGKFALGFFQTGSKFSNNTVHLYLGIWFNKIPKRTPVWTANGANPISNLVSPKLVIASDGNLVIFAQDTIVWSAPANITVSNTVVVLSDIGNLVLRSSSNSSDIFWQSFDYPTDTLLPGAKLGQNKVTGVVRRIVSRKNSVDQAPGIYSNELGLDGMMRLSWKLSTEYWNSGKWNGRFFDSLPFMSPSNIPGTTQKPDFVNHTLINNTQEIYFTDTLLDESMILHVLLSASGQWKVRIWDTQRQDWLTPTNEPENQCDVYAVCGAFTICSYNTTPFCYCMKGFSIRSAEDWDLEDRTGGCIRNIPLDCRGSDRHGTYTTDKFYSMPFIKLHQNGIGIPNATTAQACAQVCLSDCSCTAYSYNKGVCFIWHDELINIVADDSGNTLYLRLAAKEVQISKNKKNGIIIGVTISVNTIVLCLIILMAIMRMKKWSSHAMDNDNNGGIGIIAFKYVDIRHATKNFSEKLGGGGFGSVFKGCLSNSVAIAVKMLDSPRQGEKQFRAEVCSIGIIHHVNLVKLIGFCCEGDRRLLVYELMENGSLDAHLFQNHGTILDWDTRYHIVLGVARGIAYLHHSCQDCIVHCDIKPENILLDKSFTPKVADFGMAKILGRDFSRAVTTMRGTIGYLAPEWISGTAITSKVDVYSFGMVLFEIISGKRNTSNLSLSNDGYKGYFPLQVAEKLHDGDVGNLVDEKLHGLVNLQEVQRVCKIACWCIQDNEFDRPTMIEVVQSLLGVFEPSMPLVPRLLHTVFSGGLPSCL
ncbi:hypothetical protein QOZ80_4BG0353780 [Eleusine coracana subsp. coracana]|nr:hypothetical protein QOZ80_4BG0353780 [Eleusine coracana subsp. coracana]